MLKNTIILIFTLLAISFVPVNSYACKKHAKSPSDSTCCKNKGNTQANCAHKNADKNKKCKSACNHSGCNCAAAQSVSTLFPMEIINTKAPEFNLNKSYFLSNQNNISKGYYSIWLPPNIS